MNKTEKFKNLLNEFLNIKKIYKKYILNFDELDECEIDIVFRLQKELYEKEKEIQIFIEQLSTEN